MDLSSQRLQSFLTQAQSMLIVGQELALNKPMFINVVSQLIERHRGTEPFFDKEDVEALRGLIITLKSKALRDPKKAKANDDTTEEEMLENVKKFSQDSFVITTVDKLFSIFPRRINDLLEEIHEEPARSAMSNVFNSLGVLNLAQLKQVSDLLDENRSSASLLFSQWLDQADEETLEKILNQIDKNVTNTLLANIAFNAVKVYEKVETLFEIEEDTLPSLPFGNINKTLATSLLVQRIDALLESVKPVLQIVEDAFVQHIPSIDLTDYVESRRTENRRTKALIASFKP